VNQKRRGQERRDDSQRPSRQPVGERQHGELEEFPDGPRHQPAGDHRRHEHESVGGDARRRLRYVAGRHHGGKLVLVATRQEEGHDEREEPDDDPHHPTRETEARAEHDENDEADVECVHGLMVSRMSNGRPERARARSWGRDSRDSPT